MVLTTTEVGDAETSGQTETYGDKLGPLRPAEMPPPPDAIWKIIGPGVVAAGVGLGASEFILFPYLASQIGLSLLWAAILVEACLSGRRRVSLRHIQLGRIRAAARVGCPF